MEHRAGLRDSGTEYSSESDSDLDGSNLDQVEKQEGQESDGWSDMEYGESEMEEGEESVEESKAK